MPDTKSQLRRADQLIKQGKPDEAARLLKPLLRENRNLAGAWWLLAQTFDDDARAIRALEKVLVLKPNYQPAEEMLARLQGFADDSLDDFSFLDAPPEKARKAKDDDLDWMKASSLQQGASKAQRKPNEYQSRFSPAWMWPFGFLCILIPIITVGGVLPGAIGFGGAAGCYSIARNRKYSVGIRLFWCVVITVLAWAAFLGSAVLLTAIFAT